MVINMRRRSVRYQGARYRGRRRPRYLLWFAAFIALLLAGFLAARLVGAIPRLWEARRQSPDSSAPQQVEPAKPDQPATPDKPGGETADKPEPEPPPAPPQEPQVVIENTSGFELPIQGTHGIIMVNLKLHPEESGAAYSSIAAAGLPFTILREGETRVLALFQDERMGWVDKNYIMVNLPDLIPSILYKNSNAESSLMKNLGMDLEGITGQALYQSRVYNEKLEREEFIMPVQYRIAQKIMDAQAAARAQDLTIVLYEGFRPHETQELVAGALQQLSRQNKDTSASIRKNGFNISYYINTGISSHQMGSAVDVSLARVSRWEEHSFHGNTAAIPAQFTEYSYGAVLTDDSEGIKFSSARRYRPDLPDNTSTWMPTPMHELSYLSGTFNKPTPPYTPSAWASDLSSGSIQYSEYWTEGAQTLQDIFVAAGMEPLASEWWHFNDISSWNTAKKANISGEFQVGTESFSRAPDFAAALGE